ncbi:MAG: hypothetical protein QF464_18910, partial [Myxococcota bacterium]|nr:hypothetical protein [Myxococcota bacterium]
LQTLGVHDLLVSWPLWLASLLMLLNGVGFWLRHIRMSPVTHRRWTGPAVDNATLTTAQALDAVRDALDAEFGQSKRGPDGSLLVRTGLWAEGLLLVVVGIVTLVAALAIERHTGLEARIEVDADQATPSAEGGQMVVRVREDGGWIERQLPFTAACSPTAHRDPARGWSCNLTRTSPSAPGAPPALEQARINVGPDWPDEAFGLTFHIASERPRFTHTPIRLVDRAAPDERLLYEGPAKGTTTLPDGHRLTPFTGPDGPLVVVTPTEGRPYLLVPAADASLAPAKVGTASVAAVPGWRLTLGATSQPGRYLIWVGLALVLFGLLVVALVPHLTLRARTTDSDGVVLDAWSFNRRGRADAVLSGVVQRLGAKS